MRVREEREARGWSQRHLAATARVSTAYVAKLEAAKGKRPYDEELGRVVAAVGFESTDALLAAGRYGLLAEGESGHGVGQGTPAQPGIAPRPVYAWGSLADLTLVGTETQPEPSAERYPPLDYAHVILPDGFVLQMRGDSMSGRKPVPLLDGDYCWVVPKRRRAYRLHGLVAVRVVGATGPAGESGNVVRSLGRDETGEFIYAEPAPGVRQRVECERFDVLGPVVRIERSLSPD
jgi:transcriptional regulator with XRE-family HTH domain